MDPLSAPSANTQVPTPADACVINGTPGDEPSFSSLMDARLNAPAPETRSQDAGPPDAGNASDPHDGTSRPSQQGHDRLQRRDQQQDCPRSQVSRPPSTTPSHDVQDTEAAASAPGDARSRIGARDGHAAAVDARPLADWIASLLGNPAATVTAAGQPGLARDTGVSEATAADEAPVGAAVRHPDGMARRMGGAGSDAARAREARVLPAPVATKAASAGLAADASPARAIPPELTDAGGASTQQPTPDATAAALSAAGLLAVAQPGAAGAEVAVRIATPMHTAEFPGMLASQVSVLVKDGVKEARLHLNPPEMGPISVQIAMDGTRAQIDFTAAVGATRHLIEASLPMLAAALHGTGLTLGGGGVFQQPREGSQGAGAQTGGAGRARSRTRPAGEAVASLPPTRAPRPLGALDLYV